MRVLKVVGPLLLLSLALTGCDLRALAMADPTPTPIPVVQAAGGVVAEGRIVPRAYVQVAPALAGQVAEVLVAEGDAVAPGQVLLRLGDAQLSAAVSEAQAGLQAAEAGLAQLKAGPEAEQVAAAEAAVAAAQGAAQAAGGAVAAAQAQLARLQAGATAEEIAIAGHQVEAAKNALWAAQAQRDAVCSLDGPQANCDAANAAVQQATEEVAVAQLALEKLQKGATQEELDAAEAQVQQAQGQWESSRAAVAQAEAALAELKRGAAQEAIDAAEAQVAQARAALERAQAALADAELRAPIAGTVAQLNAKLGERVAPGVPVAQIADLSVWEVETDDLTENQVVRVAPGGRVTVVPDALPEARLVGTVEAIDDVYEEKKGDVTYTVRITLDSGEPRLRWGMRAKVTFE